LYGTKVVNANNRGSGGVSALISPNCPFSVSQLLSFNAYTLSIKVDKVNVHCVYFPPSLSNDLVLSSLRSLPMHADTIICGDFNARLGDLTGDNITNPRGTALKPWIEESGLQVLNASLTYGIATFCTFRQNTELSSIIDQFLSNIPSWNMVSPSLVVASGLSLGSDHRLLTLSFDYDSFLGSCGSHLGSGGNGIGSSGADSGLAPRRLWNLSRLQEKDPLNLFQCKFRSFVVPLASKLSSLVASTTPRNQPDIDGLNTSLKDCLYQALDESIGAKSPHSSGKRWQRYWTPELQAAAHERDRCYGRWRYTLDVDKAYWWQKHKEAHRSFHRLVSAAKRLSWKNFCDSLEKDFSIATGSLARIKRRRECSATYAHPDGPQASVDAMSAHLASVYDGSLLTSATRPTPPPPALRSAIPYPLPDSSDSDFLLDVDSLEASIARLPNHKVPGSDNLKVEMLKAISKDLTPVLSSLFSLCYQWSYTPSLWRVANVFPIHKKGNPSDPSNY
jgi:hypothetical protein